MEVNGQVLNFEQKNLFNFLLYNFFFLSLRRGHLPPFDWKLFKLGSVSVRVIRKNVPIFQVGECTPALPTLPVIRSKSSKDIMSSTVYPVISSPNKDIL